MTLWHFSSLSLHAELPLDILFSGATRTDALSYGLVSYFLFFFSNAHVHLRLHTPACYFLRDDQMTRWAVINELLTEHFRPSGKRVPRQTRSASGHRGRGTAVQSALCLCQPPPKGLLYGPCSPQQHHATKSISSVCTQLGKNINNVHDIHSFNCGKWLNDLTWIYLAFTFFYIFLTYKFKSKPYCAFWFQCINIRSYLVSGILL